MSNLVDDDNVIKFEKLVKEFDKAVLQIPSKKRIKASFQLEDEELLQWIQTNGERVYLGYEIDDPNWTEGDPKQVDEKKGRPVLTVYRDFIANPNDVLKIYESFNEDISVGVVVTIEEGMKRIREWSWIFMNLNDFLDFIPKLAQHIVIQES